MCLDTVVSLADLLVGTALTVAVSIAAVSSADMSSPREAPADERHRCRTAALAMSSLVRFAGLLPGTVPWERTVPWEIGALQSPEQAHPCHHTHTGEMPMVVSAMMSTVVTIDHELLDWTESAELLLAAAQTVAMPSAGVPSAEMPPPEMPLRCWVAALATLLLRKAVRLAPIQMTALTRNSA